MHKSPGARPAWLFDVIIDLDHVLIVAESLDEIRGLFQVRVSQLHLRVGDELKCTGHRAQAQRVELLPHLMHRRGVTDKLGRKEIPQVRRWEVMGHGQTGLCKVLHRAGMLVWV